MAEECGASSCICEKNTRLGERRVKERLWKERMPPQLAKYKRDLIITKESRLDTSDGMEDGITYSINKKGRWLAVTQPSRFLCSLDARDTAITIIDGHLKRSIDMRRLPWGVHSISHRTHFSPDTTEKRFRTYTSVKNALRCVSVEEDGVEYNVNNHYNGDYAALVPCKSGRRRHRARFDFEAEMEMENDVEEEEQEEHPADPVVRRKSTLADFMQAVNLHSMDSAAFATQPICTHK